MAAEGPEVGLFRSESNQLIHMDLPLPEHMADKVAKGQLVRLNDDGTTYSGEAAGPADGAPPSKPAPSSPKGEWVGWAVSCGADPEEAAASTKQDLIDAYGA